MRFGSVRKLIALTALLTAVCLLTSCLGAEKFVQSVFLTSDVRGAYVISPADHYCEFTGDMKVAESGRLAFYFDERTGNAGVYDADSATLWSALPTYPNRTAAVVSVEAFNGTATYFLNSQDHAVAFGSVDCRKEEDAVTVTFTMAEKEATAQKSADELKAGDVYVSVPVSFRFQNGRLTASVDMASVVCAPGLILYNVSILPSFGAIDYKNVQVLPTDAASAPRETTAAVTLPAETTTAADSQTQPTVTETQTTQPAVTGAESQPAMQAALGDDFILVPDGCGAVIYPNDRNTQYPELDFCVYGSDDALGRQAAVGAFGVRRGGAFVCVSTEGEELAVIRTERTTDDPGRTPYQVCARYNVTPVFNYNGDMAYGLMYTGTLSQTYGFLSGAAANCAGMAAAAREILIHAGQLSAETADENDYPVNVTLTGSVDGKKSTLLTGYEQAEAVLSLLRAKGIGKVNLILNGFLTGGLENNSASSFELLPAAGTSRELDALFDYAVKQGYDVYCGAGLLTAGGSTSAARDLSGAKRVITEANPFPGVGADAYRRCYVGWSAVPQNASRLLDAMKDTGFAGIALTDLDRGLSADYTVRAYDRTTVSEQLAAVTSSVSTLKKLLVNGACFHTLRFADAVTGVPYETSVSESEYYRAVPFVEMILHGSYVYAGEPCADASADRLKLLKAVEYGGAPHFSWTGSSRTDCCYEELLNAAAEFCVRAADELRGLAGSRITDCYEISPGVKCTVYDSGARVYVNYNNYSSAVGEIYIPPYDFIRIN